MNQNSGGKGPSSNKNMMGIVSIILWALVITLMVNFLYTSMSTSKSTKISYSEFLQMVREDKVERVLLESNKYTIYPKEEKKAFGVHASGHLSAGGDPDTGAGKSGGGGRRRPV